MIGSTESSVGNYMLKCSFFFQRKLTIY
uniref:Uncharacterized protein n=1 Tax=Arundo donax TaxID=35708 RepID=A0A0A8YVE5_ARUDO